jgi:hypothetical protein
LGFASSPLGFLEYIRKTLLEFFYGFPVAVNGEGGFPAEGADIVYAVDMIRVGMGKKDRVQPLYARPYCLKAEFGPRIYDHLFSLGPLDIKGRPEPLVPFVGRAANRAIAAYHGDSVGSTGTEDGEFHCAMSMPENSGLVHERFWSYSNAEFENRGR